MSQKPGIYLKYIEKLWYICGIAGAKIKYLHHDGKWYDVILDYMSREEAIEMVKKHTGFTMIYDENGDELFI